MKGVASNSGATKMNLLDFIMISIMSILNIYELVYVLFKSLMVLYKTSSKLAKTVTSKR